MPTNYRSCSIWLEKCLSRTRSSNSGMAPIPLFRRDWRDNLNPEISSWDQVVSQAEIIKISENVAEWWDQKQAVTHATGPSSGESRTQAQPSGRYYDFSYFVLFTYVFSLFLVVSHGAAALTHFSLTHIAATLLTHSTAIVLTHSIAILIALPHWYSIYSGQFCRLFSS